MDIKAPLLAAAFSLAGAGAASGGAIEDFFVSYITDGPKAFVSDKKLSRQDVQRLRARIWGVWREAVAKAEAFALPRADKDSVTAEGRWKLPPELENNAVMNFTLFSKGGRPLAGYPLFIYLHGSGPKDKEYAAGLRLARGFDDAPSAYFIPQIPNEGGYYRWWQRAKIYAWRKLFRLAMASGDYDPDRIYFTGISEGAYGTQRLTAFFADYLAGGGAVAGGEPLKNAPPVNCANTAFSLQTGENDTGFYRNTLTGYAAQAFGELSAGSDSLYKHRVEIVPGAGHSIDYSGMTPWLAACKRNPFPKYVSWENFPMDGCYRRGFWNLYVSKPSHSAEGGRTYYEERIEGDTILLNVDTVTYETVEKDSVWGIDMKFRRSVAPAEHGGVTIFLNRALADLSRPVTVVLNGKVAYHGMAEENLGSMVNSCALYGDPRRLYSAQVDIEW